MADQLITPGRYVDSLEGIHAPVAEHGAVSVIPSLVSSDDAVYSASTTAVHLFPGLYNDVDVVLISKIRFVLMAGQYIDNDILLTPMLSVDPAKTQLHVDQDNLIAPYIASLRGVRSNVGIVKGLV